MGLILGHLDLLIVDCEMLHATDSFPGRLSSMELNKSKSSTFPSIGISVNIYALDMSELLEYTFKILFLNVGKLFIQASDIDSSDIAFGPFASGNGIFGSFKFFSSQGSSILFSLRRLDF